MSVGFTINPKDFGELAATRTIEPSRLYELAQKAETLATIVENHWEEYEDGTRQKLAALAYRTIEPSRGVAGRVRSLRSAVRFGVIRLREDQDALFDFAIAQRHLINAILESIERDNPEYQKAFAEVINGALDEIREDETETLTEENTGDWLRQLSNEALK